jgi:hypothetical protein
MEYSGMLETELQRIYDSEINVRIEWLWDGGITIRLGDEMKGFDAEESVKSVSQILPWLQEAIAHFYPDSDYAKSLDPQLLERASRRLFWPPDKVAEVSCPNCGAPNQVPPGMEERIAFVCVQCGKGVSLPRPKVE